MMGLVRQLAFGTGCRSVMKIINCQDVVGRDIEVEGCRELAETRGGSSVHTPLEQLKYTVLVSSPRLAIF